MKEIWKEIKGFEGIYSISSFGNVRRDKGGPGAKPGSNLKKRITNDGYVKYAIYSRDGLRSTPFAHRLVAEHFIRPLRSDDEIDHINGDKSDNMVENLEPVTRLENMRRSFKHGRNMAKGEAQSKAKLSEEMVCDIRKFATEGVLGKDLANVYEVHPGTISKIILNQTWKHI